MMNLKKSFPWPRFSVVVGLFSSVQDKQSICRIRFVVSPFRIRLAVSPYRDEDASPNRAKRLRFGGPSTNTDHPFPAPFAALVVPNETGRHAAPVGLDSVGFKKWLQTVLFLHPRNAVVPNHWIGEAQ